MPATRDDIQLARRVIEDVNRFCETLRNSATVGLSIKSKLDGLVAVQAKKDKLIAGLAALGVSLPGLKADYDAAGVKAQEILDTVTGITTY